MYHIEIMISNCSYKALVFNPEKFIREEITLFRNGGLGYKTLCSRPSEFLIQACIKSLFGYKCFHEEHISYSTFNVIFYTNTTDSN